MSVGDSQKDLISVTVSDSPSEGNINNNNNNSMEKMFTVNNGRERKLLGGLLASFLGEHFSQTFQQDKITDRCDSYCHSICELYPYCLIASAVQYTLGCSSVRGPGDSAGGW